MTDGCRFPPESNWTFATLEKHLSDRIESLRESVEAARLASERALDKSEQIVSRRLDGMNEFRGAMVDQQRLMVTRVEWDSKHNALIDRVEALFKTLDDKLTATIHNREALSLQVRDIEARASSRKDGISSLGVIILATAAALSMLVSVVTLLYTINHDHVTEHYPH